MKPRGNAPGTLFNFDAIPVWLFPDLWNESKLIPLRGFWFVVLYTLSTLAFFGVFMVVLTLVFSRPVSVMVWVWLYLGVPGGTIYGLANWWDFTQLRNQLDKKNAAGQAHKEENNEVRLD